MSGKIAVAVVHGMGRKTPGFHLKFKSLLEKQFQQELGSENPKAAQDLVVEPVDYADVMQNDETELFARMIKSGGMRWKKSRGFVVDFLADAIAYQATPWNRDTYDAIHAAYAATLHRLAQRAGPRAPLCVVAHSLGSIVSSNFFYDLQHDFGAKTNGNGRKLTPAVALDELEDTPIERGHTFTHFYTCGSTLPLWSLRYRNPKFGLPVKVPSPQLSELHPNLRGEWVNFYDADDVLGYPMKQLNENYAQMVTRDQQVNTGPFPWSMTPASHTHYFSNPEMAKPIAKSLAKTWRQMSGDGGPANPRSARIVVGQRRRGRPIPA
jgi:hypothetical protein